MRVNKRFFIFLFIAIIAFLSVVTASSVRAQATTPSGDQISSDLSLDLQLAQQNPSSDQQAIVSSETKQAESITSAGDTTTVQPQDIVSPQVKTESSSDAIHPEQTTSEQVVTTPVVIDVPVNQPQDLNQPTGAQSPNDNTNNGSVNATNAPISPNDTTSPVQDQGQPAVVSPDSTNISPALSSVGTDNTLVPGTTVPAPNDNAAPVDNSTNPNLPAPTTDQQQVNAPVNTDNSSGNSNTNNSDSSPAQQQVATPPASDNSGNSGTSQPINTDNGSVQGASIQVNILQKMLNFFSGKK